RSARRCPGRVAAWAARHRQQVAHCPRETTTSVCSPLANERVYVPSSLETLSIAIHSASIIMNPPRSAYLGSDSCTHTYPVPADSPTRLRQIHIKPRQNSWMYSTQ